MRARRKAREFFLTLFFWISVVKGDFVKRIFQNLSVRPSVQKPVALESVDVASPKMRGSKKRHIPLLRHSVDFVSQKGVETKKLLPPVKVFRFREIHSSHFSCCVTPTRAYKYAPEKVAILRRSGVPPSGP